MRRTGGKEAHIIAAFLIMLLFCSCGKEVSIDRVGVIDAADQGLLIHLYAVNGDMEEPALRKLADVELIAAREDVRMELIFFRDRSMAEFIANDTDRHEELALGFYDHSVALGVSGGAVLTRDPGNDAEWIYFPTSELRK
jgi:hypothetical protein